MNDKPAFRFAVLPGGREVAYRDDLPVAEIIPNAQGWGGWVTIFNQSGARHIANPARVRTRDQAREIIRENTDPQVISDRPPPRHSWGERTVVAEGTPHECEQSERICAHCGIARITVHPPHGVPWREWRLADGGQVKLAATPPCARGGGP